MKSMIITGGAKGLGLALAEYFSKQDYQIAILDCDREALEVIGAKHEKIHCFCVDLTDAEQVEQTIDALKTHFSGRLDILINNAGLIDSAPMVNLFNQTDPYHSIQQFDKIIRANLHTAFLTTRFCLPMMIEGRKGGLVINMSSIAANGNPGQSAYSAAKAGLNALTDVWSQELAPFGIRTVGIAPGFVASDSLQHTLTESKRDEWQRRIPLQRFASLDEIIQSVQFAIDNHYLNGTTIEVNGGLRIA